MLQQSDNTIAKELYETKITINNKIDEEHQTKTIQKEEIKMQDEFGFDSEKSEKQQQQQLQLSDESIGYETDSDQGFEQQIEIQDISPQEKQLIIENAKLGYEQNGNGLKTAQRRLRLYDYQRDLFNQCLQANKIVYLPTGYGKTMVAISSMFYYLSKYGQSGQRKNKIVFLADTVQLVLQQTEAIKMGLLGIIKNQELKTDLIAGITYPIDILWTESEIQTKVRGFYAQRNDDFQQTRKQMMKQHMAFRRQVIQLIENTPVLVMISQVFLNYLRRGLIKMSNISFIVFDQCHHCKGMHPYASIINQFYLFSSPNSNKEEQKCKPIIMGLTASPVLTIKNNINSIKSSLKQLCNNLDCDFACAFQQSNIKSQKMVQVIEAKQTQSRRLVPSLLKFVKINSHPTQSYEMIKSTFPKFGECIQKVLDCLIKCDQKLNLHVPSRQLDNADLYLFFDLKSCLLIKLRDLWLQLGQYAFVLGFKQFVHQLNNIKGIKHQRAKILLQQVLPILKYYQNIFDQLYGTCKLQNFSAKVRKLIDLLSTKQQFVCNDNIIQKLRRQKSDSVLIFAFKRRTVKYLQRVLEKYSLTLKKQLESQDFKGILAITGYGGQSHLKKSHQDQTSTVDPSAQPVQERILQFYQQFRAKQDILLTANGDVQQSKAVGQILLQQHQKYSDQLRSIKAFKHKKSRVLISTSVTQQGFDIKDCNMVISFDAPESLKSFIQIQGRARKQDSRYVVLKEEGTAEQMKSQIVMYQQAIEQVKRLIKNKVGCRIPVKNTQKKQFRYVRTDGGAMISSNYSLELFQQIMSSLKKPNKPYFTYQQTPGIGYRYSIGFPPTCPCKTRLVHSSTIKQKKIDAAKDCAFNALILLKKEGLFDNHLIPTRLNHLYQLYQISQFDIISYAQNRDNHLLQILEENIQIKEQILEGTSRNVIKIYYKSLPKQQIDFRAINPLFQKHLNSFKTVRFPFQVFRIYFSNPDTLDALQKDNKINQIGVLLSLNPQAHQLFRNLKQEYFGDSEQKYYKLIDTGITLQLTQKQYFAYEIVHDFLICSTLNRQLDFYSRRTKMPPKTPMFKDHVERYLQYDPSRVYHPLLVLLKHQGDDKYTMDKLAYRKINQHINHFNILYNFNNQTIKRSLEPQESQQLIKTVQITYENTKKSVKYLILQSISKDTFFSKFQISLTRQRNQIKPQQQRKLEKRQLTLFKIFPGLENIQKPQKLQTITWKSYKKTQNQLYFSKNANVVKEDKVTTHLTNEFIMFPVAPQVLFKTYLACKHVFQYLEGILIALHFRQIFMPSLFSKCQNNIKIPILQLKRNPLLSQPGIFQKVIRQAKSKHLRDTLKKGGNNHLMNEQKEMSSLEISTISIGSNQNDSNNTTSFQMSAFDQNQRNLNDDTLTQYKKIEPQQPLNLGNFKLPLDLILRMITSRTFDSRQINNFQQLQFLGDVVLKYLATVQCFIKQQKQAEDYLHSSRKKIISNINLHHKAVANELFKYVRSKNDALGRSKFAAPPYKFIYNKQDPLYWESTKLKLCNESTQARGYYYIPPKQLADVVQSIVGAIYKQTKSLHQCQYFLHCLGVLSCKTLVPIITQYPNDNSLSILAQFQRNILGYQFRNKGLLLQAFTHNKFKQILDKDSSFIQQRSRSINKSQIQYKQISNYENEAVFYQRLQFLGDSLLDLMVVDIIMQQPPKQGSQGILSALKQSAVNNKALGFIALSLGMHHFLLIDGDQIDSIMRQLQILYGKIKSKSVRIDNYTQHVNRSFKILGDLLQSFAGALLIDLQFNYQAACKILQPLIGKQLRQFLKTAEKGSSDTIRFHKHLLSLGHKKPRVVQNNLIMRNGLYHYTLKDNQGTAIQECFAENQKEAMQKFQEKIMSAQ